MIGIDQQAKIWMVYFADKGGGFAYGIEVVSLLTIEWFYDDGDVVGLCDWGEHRAEVEELIVCFGGIEIIGDTSRGARAEDYDFDVGLLSALEDGCDVIFEFGDVGVWTYYFEIAGDETV